MRPVVVIDAVRTPLDGRGGQLSGWHPADLAGHLLAALRERVGFVPDAVGDVVLGCAMPVGSQGFNVARSAVLAAGWPDTVPAGTVDRQAVSSLAAVAAGANAVASGASNLVVVGGVEVMSTTPQGATLVPGAMPFGPAVGDRYREAGGLVPAGVAAERLAHELGLDRPALDTLATRSHARAAAAACPELVAVPARILDRDKGEVVRPGTGVPRDGLPNAGLSLDQLATFDPLFEPEGVVTAGNSAPAADGAAVVLLGSEAAVERLERVPLATLAAVTIVGADPVAQFTGAVSAATQALARTGCEASRVDAVRLSEPFAVTLAAWEAALGLEPGTANPDGGGLATGEPTGAVGAVLLAGLAHAIGARAGAIGLAALAGSGLGAAAVLHSWDS